MPYFLILFPTAATPMEIDADAEKHQLLPQAREDGDPAPSLALQPKPPNDPQINQGGDPFGQIDVDPPNDPVSRAHELFIFVYCIPMINLLPAVISEFSCDIDFIFI